VADSDGDGLSDCFERNVLGTDPNTRDTDGDGLIDGEEQWLRTNILTPNSDGDDIGDLEETQFGGNVGRNPRSFDGGPEKPTIQVPTGPENPQIEPDLDLSPPGTTPQAVLADPGADTYAAESSYGADATETPYDDTDGEVVV